MKAREINVQREVKKKMVVSHSQNKIVMRDGRVFDLQSIEQRFDEDDYLIEIEPDDQ